MGHFIETKSNSTFEYLMKHNKQNNIYAVNALVTTLTIVIWCYFISL